MKRKAAFLILLITVSKMHPLFAEAIKISINGDAPIEVGDSISIVRTIYASPTQARIPVELIVPQSLYQQEDFASINFEGLSLPFDPAVTLQKTSENSAEVRFSGELIIDAKQNGPGDFETRKVALKQIMLQKILLNEGWRSIDEIDTEEKFNWTNRPADWDQRIMLHSIRNFTLGDCLNETLIRDLSNVKDLSWMMFQKFRDNSAQSTCYQQAAHLSKFITVNSLTVPVQTPSKWYTDHDMIRRSADTQIHVPGLLTRTTRTIALSIVSESQSVEIWINDLASSVQRITDSTGKYMEMAEVKNLSAVWDGKSTSIEPGKNIAIQKGKGDLKLKFHLASRVPQIKPSFLRLELFRSDRRGEIREGTIYAELVEKQLDQNNTPGLNWGDFEWIIKPSDFGGGETELREGTYLFVAEINPLDGGTGTERIYFRILGNPPAITVANASQRGNDGIEFSFGEKKLNSRFDVSIAASDAGPFELISRDVIDAKPQENPWEPYSEIFDPWEFIRSDSQKYFAPFAKIKQTLGLRMIPPKLYFRFRAIDEAGNVFIGNPAIVNIEKQDSRPPALTLEKSDGAFRVTDFNGYSFLKGTALDRSASGSNNSVTLYLDLLRANHKIALSSVTIYAPDNVAVPWSLTIPQDRVLPNGNYDAELSAIDIDGNETRMPITLTIDVQPLDLKINAPLFSRSLELTEGNRKSWAIDFSGDVTENCFLTLLIDGKELSPKNLFTSDQRLISSRFFSDVPLKEGRHELKAILSRGADKKELRFPLIIDNQPPKIDAIRRTDNQSTLLPTQETPVNVIPFSKLRLKIQASDNQSTVTIRTAVANSAEELSQIFSRGDGKIFEDGQEIKFIPNTLQYLGVLAMDPAGNDSPIGLYPIYADESPPKIHIGSVEQKSPDFKTFDRNHLWVTLDESETDPLPARYDVAVGLSDHGPWHLISRNVIENPPSDSPWTWNEFTRQEEWFSVSKAGQNYVPFSLPIEKIKSALSIAQFPGTGDAATIFFRTRSKDFAGNSFVSAPQAFTIAVDRRAPAISVDQPNFLIVDFDGNGGSVFGKIQDEPRDNAPVKVRLFKMAPGNPILISETTTYQQINGEFTLPIPKEKSEILPNGVHSMSIVATDIDGNQTELPITIQMDIKPLEVEIPDKLYVHTSAELWQKAVELDLPVVPNSQISLRIDGKQLFSKQPVGPVQHLRKSFGLSFNLAPGEHPAIFQIYKEGRSVSKLFKLVIDNDSPSNVKLVSGEREILTIRETEMNVFYSRALNLKASASDASPLNFQWGVGTSIESARTEMLSVPKLSESFSIEIPPDETRYLALGVSDAAGNFSETYYPLIARSAPPSLQIDHVDQRSEDGMQFDRNLLWIYLKSDAPEWFQLRYDLAVSIDGKIWKMLTRDVIDQPPPTSPWFWRLGAGERWENLSGTPGAWTPYLIPLSKIKEVLKIDSLSADGQLYFKVRGVDATNQKTVENIFRANLAIDRQPPIVGIDSSPDGTITLTDFGSRPGALITGWVKDASDGTNFTDLSIWKEDKRLNQMRIYLEPNARRSWQIEIPESAAADLPNGVHELTIQAMDADGNRTSQKIQARIDVMPDEMQINNPFIAAPFYRSGKTHIRFLGAFKERGTLSVSIDGKSWLSDYVTGLSREMDIDLQSPEKLTEGEHEMSVVYFREGTRKEKKVKLIAKINPPVLEKFTDPSGNPYATLNQVSQPPWNQAASNDITVIAASTDPYLTQIRYAVDEDLNVLSRKLDSGLSELYQGAAKFSLQPNRLTYLAFEAEDQAGLKSQAVLPFFYDTRVKNTEPPELYVNGQSGTIRLYDLGQYGGLSGTVRDRPFDPENFTRIQLTKDGIAIATTVVRTDSDLIYHWDLIVPESARPLLGSGEQEFEITAQDADGNAARAPIKVNVDLQAPLLEIDDPLYMKGDLVFDRNKKSSFHLRAKVKPNSQIDLKVDGKEWVNGFPAGAKSELDERFESDFSLPEGMHQAEITVQHGMESIRKTVSAIVENAAPKIVNVTEERSNQVLRPEIDNVFGMEDLEIKVSIQEPYLKQARYFLTHDVSEISPGLPSGENFQDAIRLNLPSGSSAYLVIEIENRSESVTRQIYHLTSSTEAPITSFDPRFLASGSNSNSLSVAFNGRDAIPLAGKLRPQDSPGKVEVIGFKKTIVAESNLLGEWQLAIPPELIPQAEQSRAHLLVTGKNRKSTIFELKILQSSKLIGIALDEPVPNYVKDHILRIRGTIHSLVPIDSISASIKPEGETLWLMNHGQTVKDHWNRTAFDDQTGRFSFEWPGLQENHQVPYTLELRAKTAGGQETIYTQIDPRQKNVEPSIPIFFADWTPPHLPTLKIAAKTGNSVIFEGKADPDPSVIVILIDGKGNVLAKAPVYFQEGDDKASWSRKLENLSPGDYEVFAYAEDAAGNRSPSAGPEKFTLYGNLISKPTLNDFSKGRGAYSETSRPALAGNAGIAHSQVQIFETMNYVGAAFSDAEGRFSFTPEQPLKNGWKNFMAAVYDANGQKTESDILRVYLSVDGAPMEERLEIRPQSKRVLEGETVSFLVRNKEGVPVSKAKITFADQEAETNKAGRAEMAAPYLRGAATLSLPVQVESVLSNGIKLSGSAVLDVAAGNAWDIRFSPNGDGIDDEIVFNRDDLPITIMQWRRDEIVKTVTESDRCRWNGRKANGRECEQGLYLAQTRTGRKLVISLYR